MSEPRMTKGYALVVCENGHNIWGGETEEEAQKHVHAQCMECDSEPEENGVRWTPPRIIPPTEAETLRAENADLQRQLSEALEEIEGLKGWFAFAGAEANKAAAWSGAWKRAAKTIRVFGRDAERLIRVAAERDLTQRQLAEREAFKTYVHKRLDDAGVPVDPQSVHRDAGCRIGGRLDWVFSQLAEEREKSEGRSKSIHALTGQVSKLVADLDAERRAHEATKELFQERAANQFAAHAENRKKLEEAEAALQYQRDAIDAYAADDAALKAKLQTARRDALEEAAKFMETTANAGYANLIRALSNDVGGGV